MSETSSAVRRKKAAESSDTTDYLIDSARNHIVRDQGLSKW